MAVEPNAHVQSMVAGALSGLPENMPESVQIATANAATTAAVAAVPAPTGDTVNRLWLILVGALALVVFGSFLIGGIYALQNKKAPPEFLVTMFTTAASGLIGLFVKSPTSK